VSARAKDLFKATGGQDIASSGESSHGVANKDKDGRTYVKTAPLGTEREYHAEVVDEPTHVR
jgi:hypothetical protein